MTEVPTAPADPSKLPPADARLLFREGLRSPTAGWCAGWTRANLLAVPHAAAYDARRAI